MIDYSILGGIDTSSACSQYRGLCEGNGWVWNKCGDFEDTELESEGDVCIFLATQALEGFSGKELDCLLDFGGRFNSTGSHINIYIPAESAEPPLNRFYALKESLEYNITSADIVYLSVLYKGCARVLRCGKDFR